MEGSFATKVVEGRKIMISGKLWKFGELVIIQKQN